MHQGLCPQSKNWGCLPARVPCPVHGAQGEEGRQLQIAEAWPALGLGAHRRVKGSPSPQGTGHSTKERGCASGDSKPQPELYGSRCPGATRPGRVLGYTMDDHSAWGQRRESQKMSDRTRLWGPSQREKEGRAMNPSGFHRGAGRGRSGDNQRPTGTGS